MLKIFIALAISGSFARAGPTPASTLRIVSRVSARMDLISGPLIVVSRPLARPVMLTPMASKSMRLILDRSSLAERAMLSKPPPSDDGTMKTSPPRVNCRAVMAQGNRVKKDVTNG